MVVLHNPLSIDDFLPMKGDDTRKELIYATQGGNQDDNGQ
jgi:hypothetical protein